MSTPIQHQVATVQESTRVQGDRTPYIQREDASGRMHSTMTGYCSIAQVSLPERSTAPHTFQQSADDDGFSLLELVVAVSIMLILGVVGFVAYQSYTDNARQAALDTSANKVLTAVVAEDSAPNGNVLEVVEKYNDTSDDIKVDITAANAQGMTVEAMTCNGDVATLTAPGDYSHVDTTDFGHVHYEWTDEPHNSPSVKMICDEVVATNESLNPVGASNNANWWSNSTSNISIRTTVDDHPLGITTARESVAREGADTRFSLSLYSLGAGRMESTGYYHGIWVKTDTPGQAALHLQGEYQDIPVNEWVFLTADEPTTDNLNPVVSVRHESTEVAQNATSWATGAIVSYDGPVEHYFDGDM